MVDKVAPITYAPEYAVGNVKSRILPLVDYFAWARVFRVPTVWFMEHTDLIAFLEAHALEQAEFARLLGVDPITVWRWTQPPEVKSRRAAPPPVNAFCVAYETMTCELRGALKRKLVG